MARLVDSIKADPPESSPGDPVVAVYDFPDHGQPTVVETVGAMVREVVTGEEVDPEDERLWAIAETMDAPGEKGKDAVRAAFDRGAKLKQPEPSPHDKADPALRQTAARRRKAASGRPAGSDEFTDIAAAGLITLIAFTLGAEFQPTEDEATDLARPLGNIIARRIDLAKKLGQDANDVVAFSVALMAYMVRVGPVAADRVRESYNDRQERIRANRVTRPRNANGADSMDVGPDAGLRASDRSPRSPLDAIAEARDAQLGVLDRDFGYDANGGPPLAHYGSGA